MSIGITQLILLVIIAIILFGNIPKIFKDLSTGILSFKQTINQESLKDNVKSKEISTTKKDFVDLNSKDKVD